MYAILQFGFGSDATTEKVEAQERPLWWQEKGLHETASGYGRKLTSPYVVKWRGRWRRVYVCLISNAGTSYIGKPGDWIATVDIATEPKTA